MNLHISTFWISKMLESLEKAGPKNDEDPSKHFLKILDMRPISTRKHEWNVGTMGPISTRKNEMECW